VELAQFGLTGFVLGELYQIALLEEFTEAFLLLLHQQVGALEFVKKFFRGSFWCAKLKSFLKVMARGIGHGDDEGFRLTDERQGLLQFLFGADMRRNDGSWNDLFAAGHLIHHECNDRPGNDQAPENPQRQHQPIGDFDRRPNVPDVVRVGR
jgi:hypothetical protein